MIIGNIKKIKRRSDKNVNVIVTSSETTYTDANNPGSVFGWVKENVVLTGDCLELKRKPTGGAYFFDVYIIDNNGQYVPDKKQRLYVDFSINPHGDIDYSVDYTHAEYLTHVYQQKIASRKRKISAVLTNDSSL